MPPSYIPLVEVVFLAVFTQEEDAIDPARAEHTCDFLYQGEIVDEGEAVFIGKRHDLLVLLQEGGGVIRIVCKRIAGHIGEEVHACEPIELARLRQLTPSLNGVIGRAHTTVGVAAEPV